MRLLIQISLIIASIAVDYKMSAATDLKHNAARIYEIKRYNSTDYVANYTSLGKPWFELHPSFQCAKQSYRQPAAPQIKMLRIDGSPRFYSEVIWIEEVWTVDQRDSWKNGGSDDKHD